MWTAPRIACFPSPIAPGPGAEIGPHRPAPVVALPALAWALLMACAACAPTTIAGSAPGATSPASAASEAPPPPAMPSTEEVSAAPLEAALVIAPPALLESMQARLAGHRVRRGDHVLMLEDIAGLGRPWVGVAIAACGQLWLATSMGPLLLTGPLARPRLVGPGYLLWAIGSRRAHTLTLSRLGVLARPPELAAASYPIPTGADLPCPP